MRTRVRALWALIFIFIFAVVQASASATADTTQSSGWLHTEGKWIKDSEGSIIGLYGINTYIRLQNEQAKFVNAKSYGFDTIRLGLWKSDIEQPAFDNPKLDKSGLAAIDRAVSWSTSLDLKIIFEQHQWGPYGGIDPCWPAPGAFLSNATLQLQWLNMWRLLVDRYKNNPTVVGIDLMNEPWLIGNSVYCAGGQGISVGNPWSVWEGIAKNAVADLKTHNPNLLFIIEGWTNDHPWNDIAFLKTSNIVFSSHIYYDSQKSWVDWAKAYASGDLVKGKQLLGKWIDTNCMVYVNQEIPFWIGETGFLTSDPYWEQQMADELKLFDDRNISYSVYTFGASPWNAPYDLVDHSTPGYSLTNVAQSFINHMSTLPVLHPRRR